MGLDDLVDDDDPQDEGGSRQYVQPDIDDIMDFFDGRPEEWHHNPNAQGLEVVAETRDFMPQANGVVLRCYTTIDERTMKAREKGADAIRLVVWNKHISRPMSGKTKTLRIKTWRKNLGQKIDELMEEGKEFITICDECNSFMVIRDGPHGKFLGCSRYPDCEYSEELDE